MSRYQHLPIYKLSYELLNRIIFVTKEFPREFKFTVGQRIRDEILEVLVLIYRANSSVKKTEIISEMLEKILVIELLIRSCKDLKILALKHYAGLVEMIESLAKQAEGWKKSSNKL